MAISVIVAVEPVADDLIKAIKTRMAGLRIGDGRRGCDMGPLVTAVHRDKVAGYVEAGVSEGRDPRGGRPEVQPTPSQVASGSDRRCSTMSPRT